MVTTPRTGVGMFGPTAMDLRQQYLKNLQGQFSSAQSPYERMGLALGNILGTAFGVKDPALEQASTVQSIYSAVAMNHPDQTTPEFYRELSNTFAAAGLNEQALMSAQKAREVGFEERKMGLDERRVVATEEDIKLRREAAERKVSSEQTTTKGIRVFRRGDGPLLVEENGRDVPYNEKKHGRFETAQDRVSPPALQRTVDRLGNITLTDPRTGEVVKSIPSPLLQGAPGAAPRTGQSTGQNVTTLDQLRQRLQQK
jgi:hypothetical protein